MPAFTDYAENKIVDALLRGQPLAAPANFHIALFTSDPTDANSGGEVSGGSYARVILACSLATWSGTQAAGSTSVSNGTGGSSSNNVAIQFAAPTANWGSITHWGAFDAASGGNLWLYSPLTTPKTVNSGDTAPSFPIGALIFQIG